MPGCARIAHQPPARDPVAVDSASGPVRHDGDFACDSDCHSAAERSPSSNRAGLMYGQELMIATTATQRAAAIAARGTIGDRFARPRRHLRARLPEIQPPVHAFAGRF